FFIDSELLKLVSSFLNSNITQYLLKAINPTINYQAWEIASLPLVNIDGIKENINYNMIQLLIKSKSDWDAFERSWDFKKNPLLISEFKKDNFEQTYNNIRKYWIEQTLEMQKLEEENNKIFIKAYDLEDEISPDVPLKEITLTCNPFYRYNTDVNQKEKEFPHDEKLENRLLVDTIKEFISYAVGCMFGRYSLDKEGLILANQGETLEDYLKKVPEPSFCPDKNNVIPVLSENYFKDDIVDKFHKFLKVTFGESEFMNNLKFIEDNLGKNIRNYFLKDFYKDHIQTYKKRPIYWMFSSPNNSFNVLIYMHRYKSDTLSIILNGYLKEFRAKLQASLEHYKVIETKSDIDKSEKTQAINKIAELKKIINELDEYERDYIYPMAVKKIEIDLDDGVKVNYVKFNGVLKEVKGLSDE
ncbi:MAG: BREX-1 system adenine-specific DNA-methyltransferase PglX, partial [Candidatus Muirbacterium halophilum]|nr:BREX-1 system adenine-specific DNA-methyltransferase PglX [Candidatus Muirbacterium halophilum]